MTRARGRRHVDGVADHDGSVGLARAGCEPVRELALGHADDHGRQGRHQSVGDPIERGREPRIGGERPAVDREDADRHPGRRRSQPAEDACLRAARVQDLGPLAADERHELDEARGIPQRIDRPPDVPKRDEARSRAGGRLAERPLPVGGKHDLVSLGQPRQERGHVGLRAADLGQGDHQQHSWTPSRVRHGAEAYRRASRR